METLITSWSFAAVAFGAGCIVGGLLYWATSRGSRDVQKLKADLEATEEEFEEYKTSVSEHFNKTSELVSELTQDYVKVYKHLADGAQLLGEQKGAAELLEQQPAKVLISATGADSNESEKSASGTDVSAGGSPPRESTADKQPSSKKSQGNPDDHAAKSADKNDAGGESDAKNERTENAHSPQRSQRDEAIGDSVKLKSKGASVDAASREYISETLKEAADIAVKIDQDIPQSPDSKRKQKQADEDASVPTLNKVVSKPARVYGPPVPQTPPHPGTAAGSHAEKRESV